MKCKKKAHLQIQKVDKVDYWLPGGGGSREWRVAANWYKVSLLGD